MWNIPRMAFISENIQTWLLRCQKIAVDRTLNYAVLFQQDLSATKSIQAALYRKAGKFPLNDPSEPNQSAYVPEANRTEGFLTIQNNEAAGVQILPGGFQILHRKGKRRRRVQQELHQVPVVFPAHLFRQESTARFQNTENL